MEGGWKQVDETRHAHGAVAPTAHNAEQQGAIKSHSIDREGRMGRSLDDFAQDACADVLRDGEMLPLLEAHTTEQAYVFALANLPQGEER
jgi:hypothetical protein